MATLAQQASGLMTQYITLFESRYKRAITNFNRNREKWAFQSMIQDLGLERSREVIDFYFQTNYGHDVKYLLHNYDKISTVIDERIEDEENRRLLRERTKERVEEWNGEH